ncbi:MAG: hypothetical protein MZV63_55805 [Marinilabiliales bacterium]|nr:hypothetical protein [Marinilabiliales bacterium]
MSGWGCHGRRGGVRGNLNNVDEPGNYADPQDGQHPDGYMWQPETVLFMKYADFHRFSLSMNFHGGAEVVNYPWDTWYPTAPDFTVTADDSWWQFVSNEHADTAQYCMVLPDISPVSRPPGSTNGAAWYSVITGGRQDYHNYFKHCPGSHVWRFLTDKKPRSQHLIKLSGDIIKRSFLRLH